MSPKFFSLVAILALGTDVSAAQPLERELLRVAKDLVKEFKERSYANVGVLKFQISKDGKTVSDHVGTLNLFLVRRLEAALVLAQRDQPVGSIDNASAVAHRTRGANHLTRQGRQQLFASRYPLAWGTEEVTPDAFVTGLAQVSDDLKTLEISLFVFDRKNDKLEQILKDFKVLNLPEHLVELGESFNTRGLFDGGTVDRDKEKEEKTVQVAAQVKQRQETHPAEDSKAPVKLEVRYDGQPARIEIRAGKAFVPEPREGQKVELVLKRDGSRERFGVVLKVNGENTIDKQRLPDLKCRRWVLDPGDGPLTISGYQVNDKEFETFRVLSVPESKEREINYGADVGTITVTVFRELKGKAKPPDPSDEAKEAAVVSKGTLQTLLRLERHADGSLHILIVDLKSTTEVKVKHRLQVGFYHLMLENLFRQQGVGQDQIQTGFCTASQQTPHRKPRRICGRIGRLSVRVGIPVLCAAIMGRNQPPQRTVAVAAHRPGRGYHGARAVGQSGITG